MTHPCLTASIRCHSGNAAVRDQHHQRNREDLEAYARCPDPEGRRHQRNALVCANLRLVYRVAGRQAQVSRLGYDDLVQVGCLGLLRAVEAFDPRLGQKLSSFAVPYIRGCMLHEQRDRQTLVRIPRPLWELRQRWVRLQEERRRQGLPPLEGERLAQALHCSLALLEDASQLGKVSAMASLDAPLGDGGDSDRCLLEQLPARPSPNTTSPDDNPQWRWLQQRLQALAPQRRQLVVGRMLEGRSWTELGRELGTGPGKARRHFDDVMRQLRQEAAAWCQSLEAQPGRRAR